MHVSKAHLYGPAAVLDGGHRRGAGAAVVAADLDDVRGGLKEVMEKLRGTFNNPKSSEMGNPKNVFVAQFLLSLVTTLYSVENFP